MEISSFISVKWDQLAGYTTGAGLALQSLKSAYLGSKNLLSAFHGSGTYKERIQKAADDNLNILSNTKNFIVGSDTFSKRFSHITSAIENFSISLITGLFSYILIFEYFKETQTNDDFSNNSSTQNYNLTKEQIAGQLLSNSIKSAKKHEDELTLLRFAHEFINDERTSYCAGLANATQNTSKKIEDYKARELAGCMEHQILLKKYDEGYKNNKALNALKTHYLEHQTAKSPPILEIKDTKTHSTSLTPNSVALSQIPNIEPEQQALEVYIRKLKKDESDRRVKEMFEQYQVLADDSANRYESFKNRMRQNLGPITFNTAAFCEKIRSHNFLKNMLQEYCEPYFDERTRHQQILDLKTSLNKISPPPHRSRPDATLNKLLEEELQLPDALLCKKYKFSPSQLQILREYRKEHPVSS